MNPIHLVSASSSSNCLFICLFIYLNLFINKNTFLAGMLRMKEYEAIRTQTGTIKINNFMLKITKPNKQKIINSQKHNSLIFILYFFSLPVYLLELVLYLSINYQHLSFL